MHGWHSLLALEKAVPDQNSSNLQGPRVLGGCIIGIAYKPVPLLFHQMHAMRADTGLI